MCTSTHFILDTIVVILSILVSFCVLIFVGATPTTLGEILPKTLPVAFIFVFSYVGSFYLLGLYAASSAHLEWQHYFQLLAAVALGTVLVSAAFFFVPKYVVGRQPIILNAGVLYVLMLTSRWLGRLTIGELASPQPIAVVGGQPDVRALADAIRHKGNAHCLQAAYVPTTQGTKAPVRERNISGTRLVANIDDLLADGRVTIAVDSASVSSDQGAMVSLIEHGLQGVHLSDLRDFYSHLTGRALPPSVSSELVLRSMCFRQGPGAFYWRAKRVFDVVLSATLLTLASVPMLVVALLIKLDSRGPVFFVQERLGQYRVPFRCIKFRTMIHEAELETGPTWAKNYDPRVTRSGKVLRQTRLDELPQLVNVLRGEMTIVGPRPIRAHFADILAKDIPLYGVRFFVKPGLTGWAQIRYVYADSVESQGEKFQYELFYVQNYSFILDVYIVLKTLAQVGMECIVLVGGTMRSLVRAARLANE